MLPPGPYQQVSLIPEKLEKPTQVEFVFVGGAFDGHKSMAVVQIVMTEQVTVTMKRKEKKHLYRYVGNNTFRFEKELK